MRSPWHRLAASLLALAGLAGSSCGLPGKGGGARSALVVSLARLEKGPTGHVPQPARLGILTPGRGAWSWRSLDDPDSNVFHKAMAFELDQGRLGLLTAGGTRALLKVWLPGGEQRTLWEADFGGRFSRMRDVEVADVYGTGERDLVVATHDQGVVAVVRPDGRSGWAATELDRAPDTIVHEVEVGDLDGDRTLEIYATPSSPNRLDGTPQPGTIVKYVPARGEGRTVVADLGDRHAKEILVADVDGDGRDELYASVEAVSGGQVEIRRYDAGTDPRGGTLVARLADRLCRFLTAGDVDGDGSRELVATTHRAGLWLLRRGSQPAGPWTATVIDPASSGFEHAAVLADLDGDRIDELYVANDQAAEVNRYGWSDGRWVKTVLYTHPGGLSGFTWSIMPVPLAALP
ncbi:MAG: VCBS repeat-containing protein [Acidobacteria bacterium]|nr:VCBS repeat-containing protein [Acidobacteriota bacterium]